MLTHRIRFSITLLIPFLLSACSTPTYYPTDDSSASTVQTDAGIGSQGNYQPGTDAATTSHSPTGPVATSKLGIHILTNQSKTEINNVLAVCPKAVKWLSWMGGDILRNFKRSCPSSQTIIRVWVPNDQLGYNSSQNAEDRATHYWNLIKGEVTKYQPQDLDWVEGPNEIDGILNWYNDQASAAWFTAFWSKLADLMNAAGYHPLVGSIAVGNGSGVTMDSMGKMMRQKNYKIGWSYHAYSFDLTKDVGTEIYTSLRYRSIAKDAKLEGLPIVLTEGGQDGPQHGWKDRGTPAATYIDWLKWYDTELARDADVIAVTLFQIGNDTDWKNFDLSSLSGELSTYIQSTVK